MKTTSPSQPPKARELDPHLFSDRARQVFEWTARRPPSVWCDTSGLVIPRNALNAEHGDYNSSRTPYWREVMDLVFEPYVRQIWVYKATQIGFTRFLVNLMMYILAHPDLAYAIGLLMPDEDAVHEIFREEIQPTIDQSECMRRLKTGRAWDETKGEIWLTPGPIFGLYAGSIQRLARRSLRYVFGDEINKYKNASKVEASPIQLLWKRTSNHLHHARGLFGSTPTDAFGRITLGYSDCVSKWRYFMPCARCGFYQPWAWTNVKGFRDAPGNDKNERAEWVRQNQPCFYECENCHKQTLEREKVAAVAAGMWVSGTGPDLGRWQAVHSVVDRNGTAKLSEPHPRATNIGIHAWGILSPWLSMSQLAAEFIEAEADVDKTRDFHNARLALPFDVEIRNIRPSIYREKIKISPKPGIVPRWAIALYATFDTQKDWFAGCIRAWGWGFKSQLIWYGQAYTFDEVYRLGLESTFAIEDSAELAAAKVLLIDSAGGREDEVYQFAGRDPRIYPTKGGPPSMKKLWSDSEVRPGVLLRMVHVNHFKSALWNLIHDPDQTKWLPHSECPEQYCSEMAAEHLVLEKGVQRWKEKGTGRVEAWDIETLQRAAADMDNIGAAPAPPPEKAAPHAGPDAQYTNPLTSHKGKW